MNTAAATGTGFTGHAGTNRDPGRRTVLGLALAAAVWVATGGAAARAAGDGRAARLSDYERQIVASCLILEAASDGEDGMRAVLNVIYNRAGRELRGVVRETVRRGQFAAMRPVWKQRRPDYGPLLRRAQRDHTYPLAIRLVLEMERGGLEDTTLGATHYYLEGTEVPAWAKAFRYVGTIGSHRFYATGTEVAEVQ